MRLSPCSRIWIGSRSCGPSSRRRASICGPRPGVGKPSRPRSSATPPASSPSCKAAGGIKALRKQCHANGTDAPWWWLDVYVADARRSRIRRTVAIGGGAVLLAVLAYVLVFEVLFPVDPKVKESARRVNRGDELVQDNLDWQGALAEFRAAAEATPDAYDVWLRLGVAQEQVGDEAGARASYDRARSLAGSELDFVKGRAATYLLFGLIDQADRDNQAALAIKSDDAQAWYQQASVYEARNQVQEAIAALEKASTYAEAAHQDELTALARYRMGMMMQQLGAPQVTVTPAP